MQRFLMNAKHKLPEKELDAGVVPRSLEAEVSERAPSARMQ